MAPSKWLESSDYVSRFKELYKSNPNGGNITYNNIPIPDVVSARLTAAGLTFQSLPNLMRQALLWDMGFVVGQVNGADAFMQVFVSPNTTMASIALKWSEFIASPAGTTAGVVKESTSCPINGQTYMRQQVMDGTVLPQILKCAVELVSQDGNSAILAQDALDASVVPAPRLFRHQDLTQGWTLPAIHTLPSATPTNSAEVGWGTCPKTANFEAMIIPCETKFARAASTNIHVPVFGTVMTTWLQEFKAANPDITPETPGGGGNGGGNGGGGGSGGGNSSSNVGLIVGVSASVIVVVGALLLWLLRRRRSSATAAAAHDGLYASTSPPAVLGHAPPKSTGRHSPTWDGSTDAWRRRRESLDHPRDNGINLSAISLHRIDQDAVYLDRSLGAGAFAEVVLASYKGRHVAVKRLLPGRASLREVQHLVDEITLLSTFSSPYIVGFVGATWDKPIDLACVLEYMDMGDLRQHLSRHTPSDYTWPDKLACLYSIVEGLAYLHSFPIIHRDLKSRNVLLDATKGTKLTDFGVSREQTENTMTNTIGTGRWIAPEILKANHYSVAADVYSLGMILSEFCTHEIPYGDRTSPYDGKPLIDTAIMAMVVAGTIEPTFTDDMPPFLRDMARQCINHDPNERPNAFMLSHLLRQHMKVSL
ncbi:Aste57867_1947 [Aphanomyces stellatus]|uniref:Aste57867_1947 protein n=1 Tax=Aphanomyces stellatus TaxID=120398 RepID=A0A485K7M8_9STRA|nr:hypothetical protein As57867_001945 [Aphanomyces stellatus]VFT79152.1 Aste57867_1947 [Aphanomyces stellatus]